MFTGKTTVPPEVFRAALKIRELCYQIRLGNSEGERASTQEIRISLEYRFHSPPGAVHSDRLEESVCYAEVNAALGRHLQGREFRLIEKVAGDALGIARELARGKASVAVAVLKVRPPVPNLAGGAVFECGDFSL